MMTTQNKKFINLVPISTLDTELQMKVREIRNEENVRKWMYTDKIIGVNEHREWLNRLKQDSTQIVFVVLDAQDVPLGVVSVNAIDRYHKKTDWAYYLTASARGGLGSVLEFSFIEFIFNTLKMDKLNCEIVEGNDAVVKLHKKFLFEDEGYRRSNILKNGVRIGVHFLGLSKEDWLAGRDKIQEKYKRVFERFSVSIEWRQDFLV